MTSFDDEVQKRIKSKEQVHKEETERNKQDYLRKINAIADYYYQYIKESVLNSAESGNHDGYEIKGFCRIDELRDGYGTPPYFEKNFLAVYTKNNNSRWGGFINYYDHIDETKEVMNLNNLLNICLLMREKASHDNILLSDPLFLANIYVKKKPKENISSREFFLNGKRLVGKLRYNTKVGGEKERHGELILGINYSYRITDVAGDR